MEFQAKVTPPVRVIGRIIRTARTRKGYAASDVAEWVGVDPEEYLRFEDGAAELRGDILDHLKVLLGVNPAQEWYHRADDQHVFGSEQPPAENAAGPAPDADPAPEVAMETIRTEIEDVLRALLERMDALRAENERLKALLVLHVMVDDAPHEGKEQEPEE